MKKYVTLGALICSYLLFPTIGHAQEKALPLQKPILLTPSNIRVEPAMVPDKPAKVTTVSVTPDGKTVVAPAAGVVLAKPAPPAPLATDVKPAPDATPVTTATQVAPVPKPAKKITVTPGPIK